MTTTYTINHNDQFNSIEIIFTGKPSEAVRDALKALRFRWHGVKKVWYGYKTEEETRQAIENAENGTKTETKKTETPTVNKFGINVGDLYYISWGYEQTNVDFFQVIELVGESSIRIREVHPEMVKEEPTCSMAADRTYITQTNGELLPKALRSVFIEDQDKGDLKRVKLSKYDNKPYFKISDHHAIRCTEETTKVYESWYY